MTRKETRDQIHSMDKFAKEATSSKRKAVAVLRAAGIMNDKGEIKRQYKKALSGAA